MREYNYVPTTKLAGEEIRCAQCAPLATWAPTEPRGIDLRKMQSFWLSLRFYIIPAFSIAIVHDYLFRTSSAICPLYRRNSL